MVLQPEGLPEEGGALVLLVGGEVEVDPRIPERLELGEEGRVQVRIVLEPVVHQFAGGQMGRAPFENRA